MVAEALEATLRLLKMIPPFREGPRIIFADFLFPLRP